MNRDAMRKLCTSFFVLVMAMSALVALPVTKSGSAADQEPMIIIPVLDTNLNTVSTATVALTNVNTGEVFEADYSSGSYTVSGAPSGVYRVDVTASEYFDALDAIPEGLRFDNLGVYLSENVLLAKLPTKSWTYNITALDEGGEEVIGATVGFYSELKHEVVASGTTNSLGYALVKMYTTNLADQVYVFAKKDGYETYVSPAPVEVVGSDSYTTTLNDPVIVRGFVRDSEGDLADNVVAYLVDMDESMPWIKRVVKSDLAAPGDYQYVLAAHSGWFVLCVDADGLSADISYLNVSAPTVYDVTLDDQIQRSEDVSAVFGTDFNSMTLSMATAWSYDEAYPGLLYNDVGSLRLQLEMNAEVMDTGAMDGLVSAAEADDFAWAVSTYSSQYVSTDRLLKINDTVFVESSLVSIDVGSAEGAVTDTLLSLAYSYSCEYVSESDLDVGAPDYTSTAYGWYDSPAADKELVVTIPAEYELVWNNSETADTMVNVTGYTPTITLDPQEASGGPVAVDMSFEVSEVASAVAGLLDDTIYAYVELDDEGNVSRYFAAVGHEVNFTSDESEDPNGNPLTFTWDFGDGETLTTANTTAPHTFATADDARVVTLTVVDVAGLTNSTEIDVVCDGRMPTPVLTVKDKVVNETENSISVNEGELIVVNATGSSDDAVLAGDGSGLIEWVEFIYGDGNTSGRVMHTATQQNVTFSYAEAGTYTLVLNVTDVVGHWKNTTMTVKVNDTTAPVVSFFPQNASWGSELIERQLIYFDANATTDNVDNNTAMMFSWYFDDGLGSDSWLNGTGAYNVTHTFEKPGNYAVKVNVTDLSGNYKSSTKRITIAQGERPTLIIEGPNFDPATFEEGKTGYITLNLTNSGSAVAENVTMRFYILKADGTEELLGTWTELLNDSEVVTEIEVGGTVQVRFPWVPDAKGTYTIRVNVTADDLLEEKSSKDVVDVNEAGWKKIALWGGVAAVIILVPLLIYLQRKLSKRERKGPRREKEEKKKGGDEDL